MAIKAPKNTQSKRVEQPTLDVGNYPGRVVQIIDLGLQPQRPYQGQDKPPAHELMLTYELVDCFMVDEAGNEVGDKPRWISETFPIRSLDQDKAKSTQRYKALDPSGVAEGDYSKLIETPVNVTVVHGGINAKTNKPYENVGNVSTMRARDAEKCPPLQNPSKVFELDSPSLETFNSFPEWIQEKIKGNLNYKGSALEKLLGGAPAPQKQKEAPETEPDNQEGEEERPW